MPKLTPFWLLPAAERANLWILDFQVGPDRGKNEFLSRHSKHSNWSWLIYIKRAACSARVELVSYKTAHRHTQTHSRATANGKFHWTLSSFSFMYTRFFLPHWNWINNKKRALYSEESYNNSEMTYGFSVWGTLRAAELRSMCCGELAEVVEHPNSVFNPLCYNMDHKWPAKSETVEVVEASRPISTNTVIWSSSLREL